MGRQEFAREESGGDKKGNATQLHYELHVEQIDVHALTPEQDLASVWMMDKPLQRIMEEAPVPH